MSWLGDVVGFEAFNGKKIGKALMDDPSRLLTGVDPASTGLWNTVLGTHNKPIVDQMGGATGQTYKDASAAGINTGPGHSMQNLAHAIAAAYAMQGLSGIGGGGSGGLSDETAAGFNPAQDSQAYNAQAGIGPSDSFTFNPAQDSQAYNASVDPANSFVFNGAQDSQLANAQNGLGPVTTDDTLNGSSPMLTPQQGQALGKALNAFGKGSQQQQQGTQRRLDTQTGLQPWNYVQGGV